MGQALYRKYRPKSLGEVVGQQHITATLLHALEQGKLAHAYLFTGPRGIGKTSVARILAHQINDLPYEDDSMHLDIIEIDAASNRRIDEIRELRDKVNVAPSLAKYKVYIIDEVHMLTREAFNALLKTLEEPPAHVVFILATTESHKLPETIVSRTQRFIFKPVARDHVVGQLRLIADTEKIEISDEALSLIADHGEGSFRDSISLLDQTRGHDGPVDADYVRLMIGLPPAEAIDSLAETVSAADAAGLSRGLTELYAQGFAAPQIAKRLGGRLRTDVLAGKGRTGVFELLEKLLEVTAAHDPESYLELALLSHVLAGSLTAAPTPATTPAVVLAPKPIKHTTIVARPAADTATAALPEAPAPARHQATAPVEKPSPESLQKNQNQNTDQPAAEPQPVLAAGIDNDRLWAETLNTLKKTHNTLYGITRMAKPTLQDDTLELAFGFDFHRKRVAENKNRDVICEVMRGLTGRSIGLRCVMIDKNDTNGTRPAEKPAGGDTARQAGTATAASPDLSAISNIFGGAEVLENG